MSKLCPVPNLSADVVHAAFEVGRLDLALQAGLHAQALDIALDITDTYTHALGETMTHGIGLDDIAGALAVARVMHDRIEASTDTQALALGDDLGTLWDVALRLYRRVGGKLTSCDTPHTAPSADEEYAAI